MPQGQPSASPDQPIHFGACTIHVGRRELWVHGQMRPTPPKVFDLLALLVLQRHRMVSKPELLAAVWGDRVISDSALARTIMVARRLIDDGQGAPTPIRNLHGRGYRFVAEISQGDAFSASRPVPLRAVPTAVSSTASATASEPPGPSARSPEGMGAWPGTTGAQSNAPAGDPLLVGLQKRADQAQARERWAEAEALYHAAFLIRPSVALQEKRLQALLPLQDTRLQAVAQDLLVQADRHGDAELARRVRFQLGTQALPCDGPCPWLAAPEAAGEPGVQAVSGVPDDRTVMSPDERLVWAQRLYRQGELEQARAWAAQAEAAAMAQGQPLSSARARMALLMFDIAAGDLQAVRPALWQMVETHRAQDRPVSAAQALVWHAVCQLEAGHWADALADAQRALDWLAALESRGVVAPLLACAALVLADIGHWDGVVVVDERLRAAQLAHPGPSRAPALAVRGLVQWQQGRRGAALGLLNSAMVRAADEGQLCFARLLGQWLLRACTGSRRWRVAHRVVRRLRAQQALRLDLGLQASIGHAMACEDWFRQRREPAMTRLAEVIRDCPDTRAQAAARLDLAWILIGAQDFVGARALLRDCGAWRAHAAFASVLTHLDQLERAEPTLAPKPAQPMAQRQGRWPSLDVDLTPVASAMNAPSPPSLQGGYPAGY